MKLSTRIGKKDLEAVERRVNSMLRKIQLKVSSRYGYTAIDITDKRGNMIGTLATGLSKRQAYEILEAIAEVLMREG